MSYIHTLQGNEKFISQVTLQCDFKYHFKKSGKNKYWFSGKTAFKCKNIISHTSESFVKFYGTPPWSNNFNRLHANLPFNC